MALSFAAETKEELARARSKRPCCTEAELVAFLRRGKTAYRPGGEASAGQPSYGKDGGVLLFATGHAAVARRVYTLARGLPGLAVKIKTRRRHNKARPVFEVITPAGIEGLNAWLAARDGVPRYQCCLAAYLRGAFLAAGSVNRPAGAHHLELFVEETAEADRLQAIMERLGLQARRSRRQRGQILYLKDSEQIIRLLSLMGAHSAVLAYENVLILKDMRNQVNRLVNCETANLSKTVETGLRQAENIRFLVQTRGWDSLPEGLQAIASLRLRHPEASLKELGEMLVPPIGKSGVNHRLRRLEHLARQEQERRRE